MDVFDIAAGAGGQFLRDAAIDAGYALGVFDALARTPVSVPATTDQLATAIDVRGDGSRRRLRALLDVLVALGAIARHGGGLVLAMPPARPVVARGGWGLMAEVIRIDRPLAIDRGEALSRLHDHLAAAGADAARELVAPLAHGGSLLDLGGGAGAYTAAFLDLHPYGTAMLVDHADVLALARRRLDRFGARVTRVAGDIREIAMPEGHDTALLANVLHFYPPDACVELCRAAFRGVRPGGTVIIKDLRVDDGRAGPIEGLLFALNMAVYTDAGDVHETGALAGFLKRAGFVDIQWRGLTTAPDAIVVTGRRPPPAPIIEIKPAREQRGWEELEVALAPTATAAWTALRDAGALHPTAAGGPPVLELPRGLHDTLAKAIATERADGSPDALERATALVRHYTDVMPRMRVEQLAGSAAPAATVFHSVLDWSRLPRMTAAIDRLFAVVRAAGVAAEPCLGAPTADVLRARTPTLAALYQRTYYGGCMPLLYAYPADLAYFMRRGEDDGRDLHATIDRYLVGPVIHELTHFARGREPIQPAHLDECIGGWLGVHVHPELAYPAAGHDNAIYAAPWLAQVGQAIARAFGVDRVIRAHAGVNPWTLELPRGFVVTAGVLGWAEWCTRRPLHLLSNAFDPAPWVALALVAGAGRPVAGETLDSLARSSLIELAGALPVDDGFDRAIVADGLRAMCLDNVRIDGSFRARTRTSGEPVEIEIDARACRVTTAVRGEVDTVAPSYWLPPPVAARIVAAGFPGYRLRLGSIDAIPDAAAAIHAGSPGLEREGFTLIPRLVA